MSSRNKFIFSTPVWGEKYVDLFLNVGLPSLLAPGNLPELTQLASCQYLIYTTDEDQARILRSPVWPKVAALLPVEFHSLGKATPIADPHRAMSDCQIDSMRRADAADAAAVFPSPDMVWARGGLERLDNIVRRGVRVVFMSAIRLDRDAVVPRLIEHRSADRTVLDVSPRELAMIGFDHLHTIAYSHFWNEYGGFLLPPNLYWTVPGEGLTIRCFHLHPLMVKSQRKNADFAGTIDDDLVPNACPDSRADYIVGDSDELLAFEMSGPERIIETPFRKGSMEDMCTWLEVGANARHRQIGRVPIRIHTHPMTDRAWSKIDAEADLVISDALKTVESSTAKLAVNSPQLFAWRMMALLDGRGRYADKASPILRAVAQGLRSLLLFYGNLRRVVFLNDGAPRFWHPAWILRRAIARTLRSTLQPDQRYRLLSEDFRLATHVCSALPEFDISPVDEPGQPEADEGIRAGQNLIVLGAVPTNHLETVARQADSRLCQVVIGDTSVLDIRGVLPVVVGGVATRLATSGWEFIRKCRSKYLRGVTRPLLLPGYIVFGPLLIFAAAVAGVLVNGALLAVDMASGTVPTCGEDKAEMQSKL